MATITLEQFEFYKNQFPEDEKIQSVTYEELLQNTNGGEVDWKNFPEEHIIQPTNLKAIKITDCELSIGFVIFDAICLVVGGVAIRNSFNSATARALVDAAAPAMSAIEKSIARITAAASKGEVAKEIFYLFRTLWSADCLGAVLKAFKKSLKWYYALLYGVTAMATIAAAVLTEGAALVAAIVLELVTATWFVLDSENALEKCGIIK